MHFPILIASDYPGIDGFLGSRASFMLDFVFLAMLALVPVLLFSIRSVRQGHFELHRRLQVILGAILGVAVVLFEIDIRVYGWRQRAAPSEFWRDGALNDPIDWSLLVHLACAIPAALLWVVVIVRALRNFPRPTSPNQHSVSHRFWARLAAAEMVATAVTGWVFYYLAFAR